MKKNFILFLLIAFAAIMINAATPRDIRLTWSGSPASTQTISWTTDITDTATHKLRYRKVGGSWITKTALSEDFIAPVTSTMSIKIKSVALTGLSSSTSYQYQVSGDNGSTWIPSTYYTFSTTTTAATQFKFIVIGDSSNEDLEYSGDSNKWAENLAGAFERNPGAKFFVNVGDIVDKGQMYEDWAAWIASAQNILATKNAMMTVAKDECNYGDDYADETGIQNAPPVLFPKLWKYPKLSNVPDQYKGIIYSYDYGNVHIVSIPNQLSGYYPDDDDKQNEMFKVIKTWLAADLAATTKTWKIVVMHLNMFTTMSDRSAVKYRADYQAIFDQYNVDVVFDGHVHTIARTFPVQNGKFVDSPIDATVYYTVGMGQSEPKGDVTKKLWHHFTYDGQESANYLVVEVDGSELEISCYLDNGKKIDEYQIDKGDPLDCTITVTPSEFDDTHMVVFGTSCAWWDPRLAEWDVISPFIGQEEDDGEWVDLDKLGEFPFQDNINEDDLIIPDFNGNGASDWYVDIRTLATLINGVWYGEDTSMVIGDATVIVRTTLFYDDHELELKISENEVLKVEWENGQFGYYVSEKGLREAMVVERDSDTGEIEEMRMDGFLVEYDEDLNAIFIERYRP